MKLYDLKYYEKKHINIDELIFDKFQRIELLLFLINYLGIRGKIDDYYLILGGRGLITRHSFENGDYLIQNARILLKTLNQKKVYLDELKGYESDEENTNKLYIRKDENFILTEDNTKENREKEELYLKLLSLEILFTQPPAKYGFQDKKRYGIILEDKPIEIKPFTNVQPVKLTKSQKKKGGKLKISIKELIEEAGENDVILSNVEKAFRKRVIENNAFIAINNGKLQSTDEIVISKIVNIAGQVGAGKSTFSDVLVKRLAKNNKKILVIEPSVIKVLRKSEDFRKLGINSVPIIGSSNWKEHIARASDGKDFLGDYDSRILTIGCPLGGLVEDLGVTIEFGKEPCTEIYKFYERPETQKNQLNKNNRFKCPYYYICPKSKIQAEIPNANVIVTTTAGLSTMTIGISGITLFQHVLENIDLVIVDEAESELQKLDKLFAPYVPFDDYVINNASIPADHFKKPSDDRTSTEINDTREFIKLLQDSDMAFTKIHNLLKKDKQGFSKSSLKRPFSGKMLINNCKENNKLPIDICDDLKKLVGLKRNRRYQGLLHDLLEVNNQNDLLESFGDYDWGVKDELSKEQVNMIIFIGAVLNFEDFYRNISNLVEGNRVLPSSTKSILSQRFEFHQRYLPVSPVGNIFALQYKDKDSNGKTDLCIIKQFALGRAMYLRFPWLKLDSYGNPHGPNVMLLSGSSFAPGSLSNHINEPVNYIIEAENFKRDFISKAYFEYLDTDIYVSGSGGQRNKRLRELVAECKELILEKLAIAGNNILLVVNSYADTEIVNNALNDILNDTEYIDKITHLVSDSDNEEENDKIKQSKVSGFIKKGARILIAPAILIERGHNIVDEKGNAAFDTLIFMTRPMGRPDDYTSHVSKVNGYIMGKYSDKNYWVSTEIFSNMRNDAKMMYNALDYHGYSIDDLKPVVKKDIVVTLFVMILQIFGRLCRIGNQENMKASAPEVYFADAAFKAKKKNSFDVLNELVDYLDEIMNAGSVDGEVAKTLYEPFYNALKKGRHIYAKR